MAMIICAGAANWANKPPSFSTSQRRRVGGVFILVSQPLFHVPRDELSLQSKHTAAAATVADDDDDDDDLGGGCW